MFLNADRDLQNLDLLNRLWGMVCRIQPSTTMRTGGECILVDGVKLLRSKWGAVMFGMSRLSSNAPTFKD